MRAGIGLGSNLGDRMQILLTAIKDLSRISVAPDCDRVSFMYETSPVDCAPGTPRFLNAAMEIETHQYPADLLAHLQGLEQAAGRLVRRPKNSPRSLDLDLLYMDDLTLESDALTIPHPFIFRRQFVLFPLADICPDRVLPNQILSIKRALEAQKINSSENINRISDLFKGI